MNQIKVKIDRALGTINRLFDFSADINPDISIEEIKARNDRIKEAWDLAQILQDKWLEFEDEEDFASREVEFEVAEEEYIVARGRYNQIIKDNCNSTNSTTSIPEDNSQVGVQTFVEQQTVFLQKFSEACSSSVLSNDMKLPPLTIPPFSGNYTEWLAFKDAFLGSVDKKSIPDSLKFRYLCGLLRGEALNLVRHTPKTDENYHSAWERLIKRYDKPNHIVNSHIKSFFTIKPISQVSSNALRSIWEAADDSIRGLKAAGADAERRDPWLIYILLGKLDDDTKKAWAIKSLKNEFNSIDMFLEFLDQRSSALENCNSSKTNSQNQTFKSSSPKMLHSQIASSSNANNVSISCSYCNENHNLFQCKSFIILDLTARRNFVKDNAVCFNCLRSGHNSSRCKSKGRCQNCTSRHHTLVCQNKSNSARKPTPTSRNLTPISTLRNSSLDSRTIATTSTPIIANTSEATFSQYSSPDNTQSSSPGAFAHHSILNQNSCPNHLLPTALVAIQDKWNRFCSARVLLDSGSQLSFISERFAQKLQLARRNVALPIRGLSSTSVGKTKGLITLQLHSQCNFESIIVDAFVLPHLTSLIPSMSFSLNPIAQSKLSQLQLADRDHNVAGNIDMIIGVDKFFDIIKSGRVEHHNSTIAVETIFGWVVVGENSQVSNSQESHKNSFLAAHTEIDIGRMLQKFFEIEDVPKRPILSIDEKIVENHFLTTHARSSNGKYIVELPFKNQPTFGNSLHAAISRLHSMERKFQKNSSLKDKYITFMSDYEKLGHMQVLDHSDSQLDQNSSLYLPHHAVFKRDSSKIRVVFDGSFKTSNGISLNDSLYLGPPLQNDLVTVCLRFRRHRYVFSADVEQMYRQIYITQHHQNYQRIVWRANPTEPIQHFKLKTVTYGTSAAPFLAIRTLRQLAIDHAETHPSASQVVLNDFYVDDVMTGADTVRDLTNIKDQLIELLDLGGFPLRKWSSNCWPVLQSLPRGHCEMTSVNMEDTDCSIKVLGLKWFPGNDYFSYQVSLRISSIITKRNILSESSKIFDPLGFLTPAIIVIKILYQRLWAEKLEWDDPLPTQLARDWCKIRDEFELFANTKIPRKLWQQKEKVEYHGFADASQVAYAAVIYCRSISKNGSVNVNIVIAKSKVVPSKRVLSIPRLELCAALLLCRLFNTLKNAFEIDSESMFAWSDSKVVLDWLSSSPRRWKIFVANRTSEILDTIPRSRWNHVSTLTNPADCASRGILPSELLKNEKWWKGPDWLWHDSTIWQKINTSDEYSSEVIKEERTKTVQTYLVIFETETLTKLFEKCSSWPKILRIIAYCFRFINSTCARTRSGYQSVKITGELKASEIRTAKNLCLRWAQQSTFAEEISQIERKHEVKKGSPLKSLTPFICHHHLLRVKGRIVHSALSYNAKFPIILPKKHIVTQHIINNLHIQTVHAGASLMFAILRQNYWVLGSRNLLRSVVDKCYKCFRQRRATMDQIMGDLPAVRVQYAPPFLKTGIDYAGPISIRNSKKRGAKTTKGFIAVFVCMATKAIHLEFVSDLSTDAFIAALRRFCAIRGKSSDLYSDNGTAFRGAHRVLSEMHQLVQSECHNSIVQRSLANDGIEWHFIPPASPHFGGLWEAGVKSVKEHLKRVVGNNLLTFEEICTILTQISAILNSRPLCAISDTDLNPLTPSHFLIGRPYTSIPDPDVTAIPCNRLSNWQLLQQMVHGFWKRWHQEYLTSLQERPKWQGIKRDIQIGDLTVVKDKNLPPSKWLIARVIKLHPGVDKLIRVVDVQTAHGTLTRNITSLAILPNS